MSPQVIARPLDTEFAPDYASYIAKVPEGDLMAILEQQIAAIRTVTAHVPPDREGFRYAPGKWSIREVVGHLIDGERVFGYRALCISRGDRTPLPGFDEGVYVTSGGSERSTLAALVRELVQVREGNISMFSRLDTAAWLQVGNANGVPVSVRALAFIIAGHTKHHLGTLLDRYGVASGA
jgi:hypothetical protein